MPPKKGGGGGKNPIIVLDGLDTSVMTREQLELFVLSKKVELDRQREERNYFQQDRNKIKSFWDIAKTEFEEVKAEIVIKQRMIEEDKEQNEEILKEENQKIKLFLYDEASTLATLKAENQVSKAAALEQHIEQETLLLNDKRKLKTENMNQDRATKERITKLRHVQAEELQNIINTLKNRSKAMECELERIHKSTIALLIVNHRTEISEIEERKNKQLSELIENHLRAYDDLKTYYNDVTINNLELISSLKLQITDMKTQTANAEKVAAQWQGESKRLREPLEKAIIENKELARKMGNYDRDKAALASKKKIILKLEKTYDDLKTEYEDLQLKFDVIEEARNEFRDNFPKRVQEVKSKANRKNAEMAIRIEHFRNMEPAPSRSCLNLLRMKDMQVDELRYEAARLRRAHDDLLATCEAKLVMLGVPADELGFTPLKAVAVDGLKPPVIGKGPAGLVARNT